MLARFAPTPSGYLHLGNAVNAVLCAWLAEDAGARLALRVDDLDRARVRDAYVADIDRVLRWLAIAPVVVRRQSDDDGRYARARAALEGSGAVVFACACSRTDRAQAPCACADRGLALRPGETSLTWRSSHGDITVWRRDGIPATHLASVADDEAMGITHVVRGADLEASTALQRELAVLAGVPAFATADVRHHALVTAADGAKLSKSQLRGGPLPDDPASLARVLAMARALAPAAGIEPR